MNIISQSEGKKIWLLIILFLLAGSSGINGQTDEYKYFYRVFLSDKGDLTPGSFLPQDLLSDRAIKRREKAGIAYPDIKDLPVFSGYLDQIKSPGLTLHCTSKWMNTALFKSKEPVNINEILNFPFVSAVKIVKHPAGKGATIDKNELYADQAIMADFDRPITMINGDPVQASGFDGRGVLIAVLDAGFINADIIPSLDPLRARKGIKSTLDFVTKDDNVYGYHFHGTAIMSVLAGKIEGIIQGTSPGADFLLIRTEDNESEFPVEEDFWAAGAEYADSAGADIISSSLGYFYFDDPSMNYTFSDMDGNTAFVTQAADIAASKGILVVASAGNERDNPWKRIIAPSDGDSVICVGAVNQETIISAFSSAGPSADGRIKPDNAAMGVNVPSQIEFSTIVRMSGTSLSCPVLSGMTACLLQAVPEALNTEIINAVHLSADRYNSPDSLYGYGIPDIRKALSILQDLHLNTPEDPFVIGPNPTTGRIEITFHVTPDFIMIEIFTLSGASVFRKDINEFAGRKLTLDVLNSMQQGLYILRLSTGKGIFTQKIIKINDL